MSLDCFKGRKVLVTGHTGFKGTWLVAWLEQLGANVAGVSLPEPVSEPSLFDLVSEGFSLTDHRLDIRDLEALEKVFLEEDPDFVFHLAAQPLVRKSYSEPLDTWSANVTGTAHVLEILRRHQDKKRVAVLVTTDKCYLNREWNYSYREDDPLGGYDPYSASKAGCEILISSYRQSYEMNGRKVGVTSVRAGNVIGGGDWAEDRILPDCMNSIANGTPIQVRNRHATRPWQHVLDPLSGYLKVAALIDGAQGQEDESRLEELCSAFNFGPELASNRSVAELVDQVTRFGGGSWIDATPEDAPHEASKLNLAIDKAFHTLNWSPTWNFETAVEKTVSCYQQLTELESFEDRLGCLHNDIESFSAI